MHSARYFRHVVLEPTARWRSSFQTGFVAEARKNRMFCSNEIAVIGNVKLLVFQLPFCKKKSPQRILFDCEELPQIRLMFISSNLKISSHSFKTKSNNGVGNISLKVSFLKSLAFGLAANIKT